MMIQMSVQRVFVMVILFVLMNLEFFGVCVNYIGQVNGQVYYYIIFFEFLIFCENFDFYLIIYSFV